MEQQQLIEQLQSLSPLIMGNLIMDGLLYGAVGWLVMSKILEKRNKS